MTHDAFAERLLDLAYGELSPREARKVEAHAVSCEACRAELARIRETRRLMAALPDEPAPEEGERILLAAAREAAERRVPRRRLPPWLWGATLVAASLVAVAAVSYRIMAMRPGPLQREDTEALLGASRYAAGEKVAPVPAQPDAGKNRPAAAPPPRHSPAPRAEQAPEAPPPLPAERKRAVRADRASGAFAEPPRAAADAAPPPPADVRAPPDAAVRSLPAGEAGRPSPPASNEVAPVPRASSAPSARADRSEPVQGGVEREGQEVRGGARAAAKAAHAPEAAGSSAGLAFAGPLRAEVRAFERCEGESTRRVETDARGRVARYVREGTIAGRRVRIVHAFRPDGGLAAVTAQDLDAGAAALDARALGIAVPERAEEARIDAPPRCGR